jgi:hypothetical protein
MSVTALHTLYAVDIDTVSTDLLVDEVVSFALDPGITELIAGGDGSVDNTFVAAQLVAPRMMFASQAIGTVLDVLGITGLLVNDGVGLQAYFQKMQEGGVRATGATHLKMTATHCMVVPRTIDASQENASIAIEAVMYSSDGTTSPVAIADNQSLTGTPSTDEEYVAGPVAINGTTVNAVQSISLDFGLQLAVSNGDGQAYPTFIAILKRQPIIRVRTLDMSILTTLTVDGVAQGATDSVVYLAKVTEGGTRESGAGSAISFTVDDGRIKATNAAADGDTPAGVDIEIFPTFDGTTAVLVINTADTLP